MKEARMKTAKRSDEWAVCLSLLSSLRSFPSPIHLIRRSRAPPGRNEMDDVRRRGVAWRAAIMSEPREGGGYRRQQRPRDRRRSSSPYGPRFSRWVPSLCHYVRHSLRLASPVVSHCRSPYHPFTLLLRSSSSLPRRFPTGWTVVNGGPTRIPRRKAPRLDSPLSSPPVGFRHSWLTSVRHFVPPPIPFVSSLHMPSAPRSFGYSPRRFLCHLLTSYPRPSGPSAT